MTLTQAYAYMDASTLRTDTCWVWLGPRQKPQGYSIVALGKPFTYLHRLAYARAHGPIPDGLVIDHLCRRPYCLNPDHMEAVTRGENARRGRSARGTRTHCPNGHAFTGPNLILEHDRLGRSHRRCRTCKNAKARARYRPLTHSRQNEIAS